MTGAKNEFSARDRELVNLIHVCRKQPKDPGPMRDLVEHLQKLLTGMLRRFPEDVASDALYHAWQLIFPDPDSRKKRNPVEEQPSPCALLLASVKRKLDSTLLAEKHGVPEAWVRSGLIKTIRAKGWVKLTEAELAAGIDVPLCERIGDQDLSEASVRRPSRSTFHPVFEEVHQLLLCSGWPAKDVEKAVDAVESRANGGAFSQDAVGRALRELPPDLRYAFLDLVGGREGYVYLRLKGMSPSRILDRSSVIQGLQRLAWPETAQQNIQTAA